MCIGDGSPHQFCVKSSLFCMFTSTFPGCGSPSWHDPVLGIIHHFHVHACHVHYYPLSGEGVITTIALPSDVPKWLQGVVVPATRAEPVEHQLPSPPVAPPPAHLLKRPASSSHTGASKVAKQEQPPIAPPAAPPSLPGPSSTGNKRKMEVSFFKMHALWVQISGRIVCILGW